MNDQGREDLGNQPKNPVTMELEVDRQLSSMYRKWSEGPMLGILGCPGPDDVTRIFPKLGPQ